MLKKFMSALRSIPFFGKEKSEASEIQALRAAAQRGDAAAQYNLGLAYMNGGGVARHHGEAMKYYRLVAHQGFEKAITALNDLYPRQNGY